MSNGTELGSKQNPLRVAVVGSGPSGFYATEALLKSEHEVLVDMIERLPAPFGLVRSGVAPDHPKLKQVILAYEKIAQSPGYTFIGNVTVGEDVTVDELKQLYHAVIFACGAETDRKLGIPGEDLTGSHTATEFVGWYNGHPDYRDRQFDLGVETAVIIGQGNVAADVCRILGKRVDDLKHTDIAQHALDALAESRIRDIHVVGRRGPAQAKFTHRELRELGDMPGCAPVVRPGDLTLNPESEAEIAEKSNREAAQNFEIFKSFAERDPGDAPRRLHFHFLESPKELKGDSRLEAVVFEKNRLDGEPFKQSARGTGETVELPCGILFRSIGYRGVAIDGVPFDDRRGVFPNEEGRILNGAEPSPQLYAAGWIKRGPTGIIGTNRADAVATVKSLLSDLSRLPDEPRPGAEKLLPLLEERGLRPVSYDDWRRIDAEEVKRGEPKGKPREKFTRVEEMLGVIG